MYESYQPQPVFGSVTMDNPLVGPESYGLGEIRLVGPDTYGLGQAQQLRRGPRRPAMVVMQPVAFRGLGQADGSSPASSTGMLVLATIINVTILVGAAYVGSRWAMRAGCPR